MRARPNPRSRAREERRESHPDRAHNSGRTTRRMVTTATTVVSLIPQLFHTVVTFVRRGYRHGRQARVSWRSASVRQVSAPLSPPSGGDRGDAEPRVRAALAACLADDPDTYRNAYLEAVSTLCAGARLFMPVMADEAGEIGAVKLTNEQGSTALLAFTGIGSTRPGARCPRPDRARRKTREVRGRLGLGAQGGPLLTQGPGVWSCFGGWFLPPPIWGVDV